MLVVIMILALVPLAAPLAFRAADKVEHLLTFAFLAVWFLGVFEPARAPRVAAGLLGYGVLMELLQGLTTYRSADPYDVLSDLVGIGAGWLLASAGLRHWCRRVEAFMGAGPP